MSRRGAGTATGGYPAPEHARELQLIETPALGRMVMAVARALLAEGMRPPEASSLLAHAAAHLAQQGESRLTRDEWLTLCAVLWDGPDGSELVSAPGGEA